MVFVLVCFVVGYWLLSKIIDWSKKQVEGTAPKIHRPADEPAKGDLPPNSDMVEPRAAANPELDSLFHLFSMMGKLALCDGPLRPEETAVVDLYLSERRSLDQAARGRLFEMLRSAYNSPTPFDAHAKAYCAIHAGNVTVLRQTVNLLTDLANADGPIKPQEQDFLVRATTAFGLS
jgi:hypothetical protein